MAAVESLTEILEQTWTALRCAVADSSDAFRTPALGTIGDQRPCLRTVVLRRVEPSRRTVACYTDARSAKVREIRACPAVSWLFFCPKRNVQIRTEGPAAIHHLDAVAREAWSRTSLWGRRGYCVEPAPETEMKAPSSGLPASFVGRAPTEAESEAGWPNFAVIATTIDRFDWLRLDDARGHRRAQFAWSGDRYTGRWVVP
jgi:pyridoxamine 5'-phosphate oxidase